MTAGVEGLAAWPPGVVATVVAALVAALTLVASADSMYEIQILRDHDAVFGTIVLELITGRDPR